MTDFFCEAIKVITSSPAYSIAAEQFDLRMRLVEAHLQEKFPQQWKQAASIINKPSEPDVLNLLQM